jgi:hypothetical protein
MLERRSRRKVGIKCRFNAFAPKEGPAWFIVNLFGDFMVA